MRELTQERLKLQTHYDPETGVMTRYGKQIQGRNIRGAAKVMIDYRSYTVAQLAFLYMTGKLPSGFVMRRDADNTNDRWDNLYIAPTSKEELTHEMLLSLVHYDPETGGITKRGKTDWCQQKRGYMLVSIGGVQHKAHRLAWFYMTGSWPKNHIDHIDGDPTNNRWSNLRDVTRSQNLRNQHRTKRPDCGVYKRKNRWIVSLTENGIRKFHGSFINREDAVLKSQEVRQRRDKDICVSGA